MLDLRNNKIQVLEDIDILFPSSLKTLYLQQNEICSIIQPRNLNFLDNLSNINLNQNPIIQTLTLNNVDPKIFLLFLLNNKLKKVNNSKVAPEDKALADQLFVDSKGKYN